MTWSFSVIPSEVLARRDADKPIFIANNILETANTLSWTNGLGGANVTDADHPTAVARDGYTHRDTRPNAALLNPVFVVRHDATTEWDCAWAVFAEPLPNPMLVSIFVSRDASFSSSNIVANASPAGGISRFGFFDTNNDWAVSGSGWIGLSLNGGGGSAFTPQLVEFWIGSRIQLRRNSSIGPFHDVLEEARAAEFESESGVITRYEQQPERRLLEIELKHHEDVAVADIKLLKTRTRGLLRTFVYVENPGSTPNDAPLFVSRAPRFALKRERVSDRVLQISAVEQGGNLLSESAL